MSHVTFGWKDVEGETFDKLHDFYKSNIKKIDDINNLNELKKLSRDLAKQLHGFQVDYWKLMNKVLKSKRVEFQFERNFRIGRFIIVSYYIEKFKMTKRQACWQALNDFEVTDSQGAKIINEWKKGFETENSLDKLLDTDIPMIKQYQKFIKEYPQYNTSKNIKNL